MIPNLSLQENLSLSGWDKHEKYAKKVIISLTKGCNLGCSYCFVDKTSKNYLKVSEIKEKIIKVLGDNSKVDSITFFGGEPLLRYDAIVDLVNFINNLKKRKMHYYINTNATLINKEMISFFKRNNISIGISLDGDRETNDFFRKWADKKNKKLDVPSSYDIINKKDNILRKINPDVTMVITSKTYPFLLNNFRHIVDRGFKRIKINPDINHTWSDEDIKGFYYSQYKKKYH